MPQETKSIVTAAATLEGVVCPMASEVEIRAAVEQAFSYRGDVTLTLKDGQLHVGYIFDRQATADFAGCRLRLIPKDSNQKLSIAYQELAGLSFSGRDTAAGKSFETWVKKYQEKKAAGQTNIRIEPEKLD